jgi:hypothetical protein
MTMVWQHHGKLGAITWMANARQQEHGKNLARYCHDICSRHALAMARACQERGKNMARPWHEHGNIIMVIT